MSAQIDALVAQLLGEISAAGSTAELADVERRALGKKGELTLLLRGMKDVPAHERPKFGRRVNEAKAQVSEAIERCRATLEAAEASRAAEHDRLDVTLPGRGRRPGRPHPMARVLDEMCEIFIGMGFTIVEGPEIETRWYNFSALNIPDDHPVMDEKNTFFLPDGLLLRTETSAIQARVMEAQPPPVRILGPGRCYRRDAVDATHTHTFHQVEALVVDEGISFADLKGTVLQFFRQMYGPRVRLRIRPDFFPFVEPGGDVSFSCHLCDGPGCPTCKYTGWIELGGCGMVHPNVLRNVGYDAEKYTGFAFGFGLERMAMLKYGIDDIRLFYENDIRFLEQFG